MIENRFDFPDVGLGIGLRTVHFNHILEHKPEIDWFEILSENFMLIDGRPMYVLDQIAEQYRIIMHGVSLNIGSTDPINFEYLQGLKDLAKRTKAIWLGDHVCWTGVAKRNGHDLYPIPYTEESLKHVINRIRICQDFLERPLVMENPSTYMTFAASCMPEDEFIARMADKSNCALLLDVNNVYVTCRNNDLNPFDYLRGIPYDRVVQIHLAGHTDRKTHCIDTHDGPVINPVWKLYAEVMKKAGPRSTLLEWDDKIPTFDEVHAEVLRAQKYRKTEGVAKPELVGA